MKQENANDAECPHCLFDLEKKDDFRFNVIVTHGEEEKTETFLGFKSSLSFYVIGDKSPEEAENNLNQLYEGKKCSLSFTFRESHKIDQLKDVDDDEVNKVLESLEITN